jgi:hypothetical protein
MEAQITHCAVAHNGDTERYNYQKDEQDQESLINFTSSDSH